MITKTKIFKVKAKSIFTRTKIPGAKWAINQYVGCQHSCLYCYAKFMCRWRPKNYGKWGTWVEVKINAPKLVKGKYVDGWVYMSSVSDPYQPIEKQLKLTREVLKSLDKRIKLSILTKSDLILRDIDILKKFKNLEVGLTINSFNGRLKTFFEPFSPTNQARIYTLKILKENGLKTYSFISPIIPDLIDIRNIIKKTRDFTDFYWFEMLNLRLADQEFIKIIKRNFPKSFEIMNNKIKFNNFLKECQKIINLEKINCRGIEVHY